ncbi:hypothetical protein CWO89_30145 [Bradyrhizobium sp. Leo170]|nr:hypothetical protein CWO89_30145 [Bradyrhizobium sp. Leo170]
MNPPVFGFDLSMTTRTARSRPILARAMKVEEFQTVADLNCPKRSARTGFASPKRKQVGFQTATKFPLTQRGNI